MRKRFIFHSDAPLTPSRKESGGGGEGYMPLKGSRANSVRVWTLNTRLLPTGISFVSLSGKCVVAKQQKLFDTRV